MIRGLAPTILGIVVFGLAACGGDDPGGGFDADPAPIDPELVTALSEGDQVDSVPEVQRNYLNGCVKGFDESIPELEPVQRAGLLQVCGCTYERLVGHAYDEATAAADDGAADADPEAVREALDEAAFEAFTEIEEDLRSGDGELSDEVRDLVRACIRTEAGL